MSSAVSVGNGSLGGECYFIVCDSSANHCPQFSYLSLNDAIWTFSKAIVLTEEKNPCLTACLSDRVLSVYFGFLCFLSKNGILLLKLGKFESANPISTPKQKFHYSQFSRVLFY